MKLGILETGEVRPELKARHGDYPAMFEALLGAADPTLEFATVRVVAGEMPATPGQVAFRLNEDVRLPAADASFDAVYCISVIEHVPAFEGLLAEVRRVLKPGGLAVLTIDLDLRGDKEISPAQRQALWAAIKARRPDLEVVDTSSLPRPRR